MDGRVKSVLEGRLICDPRSGYIKIVFEPFEEGVDLRVRNWVWVHLGNEILLGNVCDIGALSVFREEMVKWLFFSGAFPLRDRQPPFLSVGEFGVDVENHTSERVYAMLDDLSDLEFCGANFHGISRCLQDCTIFNILIELGGKRNPASAHRVPPHLRNAVAKIFIGGYVGKAVAWRLSALRKAELFGLCR